MGFFLLVHIQTVEDGEFFTFLSLIFAGVTHGSEIFYLSGFPMSGHSNFRYDDNDKKMSKLLIHMWANFVYNG